MVPVGPTGTAPVPVGATPPGMVVKPPVGAMVVIGAVGPTGFVPLDQA